MAAVTSRGLEPRSRDGRAAAAVAAGLALAAAAGVVAAASPVAAIGVALGAAYVWTAYRSLPAGLCLFTVLTFYATASSVIGGGLTLTKVAGIVLAGLWLLAVALRSRDLPLLPRDLPRYAWLVLALTAWELLSILWARDTGTAVSAAWRLLQGLVLVFVVYTAVSRPEHVEWLTGAFVGGALLAAFAALAGGGTTANGGRASGGFDDPNEFAAIVVPAAFLAAFAFAASRRPSRWLYLLALPVLALAFRDADSQGGLVALAVGAAATALIGGPVRRQARIAALAVLGYGTIRYVLLAGTSHLEEGGQSRTNLWHAALAVWRDHPIAGVGAGNFQVVEPQYAFSNVSFDRVDLIVKSDAVHNTYLHVLAETGAVGLLLFVLVIVAALAIGWRAVRVFDTLGARSLSIYGRGLLVAACAIAVDYAFQSGQYEKQLWLLVGICVSLHALAARLQARRRPRPEPGRTAQRIGSRR